eukprot:445752_1
MSTPTDVRVTGYPFITDLARLFLYWNKKFRSGQLYNSAEWFTYIFISIMSTDPTVRPQYLKLLSLNQVLDEDDEVYGNAINLLCGYVALIHGKGPTPTKSHYMHPLVIEALEEYRKSTMYKRTPVGYLDTVGRNTDGTPLSYNSYWLGCIMDTLRTYNQGVWQANIWRHYFITDILLSNIRLHSVMYKDFLKMLDHTQTTQLKYYRRFEHNTDKILLLSNDIDYEQGLKINIPTCNLQWDEIIDRCELGYKSQQYLEKILGDEWDEKDIYQLINDKKYLTETLEMSPGHAAKFIRIGGDIKNLIDITVYKTPDQVSVIGSRWLDPQTGFYECAAKQIYGGNMDDRPCIITGCNGTLRGYFAGYSIYDNDDWDQMKNDPNRSELYKLLISFIPLIKNQITQCADTNCTNKLTYYDEYFMKCTICNNIWCPYSLQDYDADNRIVIDPNTQPLRSIFGKLEPYTNWAGLVNSYRQNYAKLYLEFNEQDEKVLNVQIKHNGEVLNAIHLYECKNCNFASPVANCTRAHLLITGCSRHCNFQSDDHKLIEEHWKSCPVFTYKSVNQTIFKTLSEERTSELVHFIFKDYLKIEEIYDKNNKPTGLYYKQRNVCCWISHFTWGESNKIAYMYNAHKMEETVINNVKVLAKLFRRRKTRFIHFTPEEKDQAGKWYIGGMSQGAGDESDESDANDGSDESSYYYCSAPDSLSDDNSSD